MLQAAADGAWEDARSVAVPATADAAQRLVRDAGAPDADVAVEFEWLGHPVVFAGARRSGDARSFEAGMVALAAEDPPDPRVALARLAGGPPSELDHVELGAANAWRSVGPLRLWTRGDEPRPPDLAARLADHPALARCVAPVALEVAFRQPRDCWLGVEVSAREDGLHVVGAPVVEALVARLFGVAAFPG